MILRGLSRQQYQLETKPFSSGGEGDVYGIAGLKDKVIKVYHPDRISTELEEKLTVMVRRPPNSRVLSQVAWPLDLVYDSRGFFCGFVMPRLSINAELNDIYGYPPRTNITYQQKLIIAQNICAVISEIHNAGYVFGDFNPNNIGINTATGRVAFLDTDSYHITDGNKTYRCKVCLDGYVAPELIKKCEKYPTDAYANAPLPTFTKETDNFALAIHIFKLLMNGYTPFNGIKETQRASTASPGVGNQAIKRDQYCFKPGNKPMSAAVPPIDVLPTEVADLFTRAFMDGRIDPKLRPSAYEWYKALESYEQSLVKCKKNSTHMYRRGLKRCPWCDADEAYKIAIAPTQRPAPAQKTFAQPVQPVSSYTPPVTPPIYTPPANQSPYTPQSGSSSPASPKQQGGSTQGNGGYTGGRRKRKGWLLLVVIAILAFLFFKTDIFQSVFETKADGSNQSSVQLINDPYEIGKTLYFGHYEQDGNLSNGAEAIEWIILDNQGDAVMLISKLALENKYYDENSTGFSYKSDWENCTLRKWLNDSFYTKAFNNNEQSKIILSTVSCCNKTSDKGYTKDKVFLLSDEEDRKYFRKSYSNMCAQSDMAFNTNGSGIQNNTTWWLRITENASKYAPVVCPSPSWTGTMRGGYEDVYMTRHGVRPVIWMKKN